VWAKTQIGKKKEKEKGGKKGGLKLKKGQ